MNNLVEKFESIKTGDKEILRAEDMQYIEEQIKSYTQAYIVLNESKNQIDKIIENPEYQFVGTSSFKTNTYKYGLALNESFRIIKGQLRNLNQALCEILDDYFKERYNIKISEAIYRKEEIISTEDVLNSILEKTNNVDFYEYVENSIKTELQKDIELNLNNKKISFESGYYFYKQITCAISYFENNEVKMLESLKHINDGIKYDMDGAKIVSFKLYKNNKVEVVFKSNEYAKEFMAKWLNRF